MAKQSPSTSDKPGDSVGVGTDSPLPIEDQIRQVKRRLMGVSHEQLAEEKRTHDKREAAIEARKRRG